MNHHLTGRDTYPHPRDPQLPTMAPPPRAVACEIVALDLPGEALADHVQNAA